MVKSEKRRFIRGLTANVLRDVLANVDKMPEHWDGHELRRYLADKFDESASWPSKPKQSEPYARRSREYRNTVLVNNL